MSTPSYVFNFQTLFWLFLGDGMKFCPKLLANAPKLSENHTDLHIDLNPITAQSLEKCCDSNIECDSQKRFELNDTIIIDRNERHCECENKFRECITLIDHFWVNYFGEIYFNYMTKCYSEDHPIVECVKSRCYYQPKTLYTHPIGHMNGAVRCEEYKLDESKPKMYQSFDLPLYVVGLFSLDYEKREMYAEVYEETHN